MTPTTLPPQPIPLRDGQWWIGARMMRLYCLACGDVFARLMSIWTVGGWLVKALCPRCAVNVFGSARFSTEAMIGWSHFCHPWFPLQADPGPRHDRMPMYGRCSIPDSVRGLVFARDGYTCQACGSQSELTIDHIHPVSQRGRNSIRNFRTLCRTCNSRKGARA